MLLIFVPNLDISEVPWHQKREVLRVGLQHTRGNLGNTVHRVHDRSGCAIHGNCIIMRL